MNTVELASKILTQLGFSQEPSKELGVDDRRDNIVHLIEEYTHPAKELTGGYEVMALNEYDVTVCMPISDWQEILRKAQK